MKITEKVSFNIASYVYILSGQKFIKKAKNGSFWRIFGNLKHVVKQVTLKSTKIGGKSQNSKNQMRHFELFSNNVHNAQKVKIPIFFLCIRSPDWKSKDVQYVALDGERNLYFTFLKASEVIQSAVEKVKL